MRYIVSNYVVITSTNSTRMYTMIVHLRFPSGRASEELLRHVVELLVMWSASLAFASVQLGCHPSEHSCKIHSISNQSLKFKRGW